MSETPAILEAREALKDPRQMLNEMLQARFGRKQPALNVQFEKLETAHHAQKWKCAIYFHEEIMGASGEKSNKHDAKKDAAANAIGWLMERNLF
jgi:dsRNA-specific ribonuclease